MEEMINWVTEKVTRTIETLPKKDVALNFLEDLRNKSPDKFLKTKNYYSFLKINCFYYFDEKKIEETEIDERVLKKVLKKIKRKYKDPVG